MKNAVTVAVALLAIGLAGFALRREAARAEDLERRLAAIETEVASLRAAPRAPAPEPEGAPMPADGLPPPVAGGDSKSSAGDKRLAKLERDVDRLEERMKELSRASQTSIEAEIAGLPADKIWEKAQMARQDRLTGRANALLRAFLERFPNDPKVPQVLLELGGSELMVGDWPEAIAFYDRILKEYPESSQVPYAEFYLGMSLVSTGDLTAGAAHYEKSVEKFADNPYWAAAALFNLGEAYAEKGQPELAKDYFRRITAQYGAEKEVGDLVTQAEERLKTLEGR
ncbi:MAG: MprA protease, GlyGly-CTERM protein-sorting domain-containing form [Planctomycetes bacterium]|nr:MprA protease, GlyGly-CTERM protein-sorting domain-containing form [Planctomycetota bacterium]